jgi:phosphoribosylaminoimidazole carboxylase PurE protein
MNALMGGQVDLLCDQTTSTTPFIKAGSVKLYGVTTANRLKTLPDTPTLAEQGLKGFQVVVWHGIYAPKGTPKEAIDKFRAALKVALKDPAVAPRLAELGGEAPQGAAGATALVGIIMGSDSDLPAMKQAAIVLRDFGIPFELTIVSAHRTPQRMVEYARGAHMRGLRAIIAGAGGAAHLPGMVAALTPLPVIGVPIVVGALGGQDALLSIVQMPRGIPVATVAIGNAANAGLLAARILASHDPALQRAMLAYQESLEASVMEKVARLDQVGWENYET